MLGLLMNLFGMLCRDLLHFGVVRSDGLIGSEVLLVMRGRVQLGLLLVLSGH